jgi:hypothetical protein
MAVEYNEEGEPANPEVSEVADVLYRAIGPNWEVGFQDGYYDGAQAILDSEWLRIKLRDSWDSGAARAGRYGHEDSWYDECNPHNDNPHRTEDEKEEY